MTRTKVQAVIVGAGIGGLALANALRKVGVYSIKVLERAPCFTPTAGAGFGFSPNGQLAVGWIAGNLSFQRVLKLTNPLTEWVILNPDETLFTKSLGLKSLLDKYGLTMQGTLRADLVNILEEPLKEHGCLHFNSEVATVVEDKEKKKVITILKNGEEFESDFLVGADGINSLVSKSIFKDSLPPPIFSGENILYGVIPDWKEKSFVSPYLKAENSSNALTQTFSGGEALSFPVGEQGNTLVWAATYASNTPPNRGEWDTGISSEHRKHVAEEYLLRSKISERHYINEALHETDPSRILHFGLFFRQVNRVWHSGRIGLLGDACHATLPYAGQGANMALEDAVVFAQCFERAKIEGRPIESVFQEYTKFRFSRTKLVVNSSRMLGKLMHTDKWLMKTARNFFFRTLGKDKEGGPIFKQVEGELLRNSPVPITYAKELLQK